jgi:CDP-diacylglycerol--serine O-phosphatidyltransferase
MEAIKKGIPSFITSLGLISGCISIVLSVSHKDLTLAGYFILIAALIDFADGFAARMLNSITEFGKQLDSLSDVISFGVAPSMILFRLMELAYVKSAPEADFDYMHPEPFQAVIMYSTFLVAVFSALRLARFNLDPKQAKIFKGLAVPANALLIAGLGFATESGLTLPGSGLILNQFFLLAVTLISCYLLVSKISMFSLKFTTYDIRNNYIRYIFLLLSIVLLVFLKWPGLTPVIILYIILSIINNWVVGME